MRWLAALGWGTAGLWLVLFRYLTLSPAFRDSRDLYIGLFCLGLAVLIAIGRRVGRIAAGYGTGVAVLIAVGSVLLGGMAGSGVFLIASYMAVLAFVSYRSATDKP
jgi:hypothetical protein